jgi:hypothetical protein
MAEVAALLPSRFGHNFFGFEVRLGAEEPAADFLVAVNPEAGDLETLAALPLPKELRREHAWSIFGPLAEKYARGKAAHGQVGNLWLEFDVSGPVPSLRSLPSLFFMPAALLVRHRQDHARAFAITEEVLKIVCRETLDCLTGDSPLLACAFDLLPPAGSLFQIGVMSSRPSRLVRACAALHNRRTLLAYLEAIGYPGNLDLVLREVEWLRRHTDRLRFNLDLGCCVRPKLGIEAYIQGAGSERRWRDFLPALVRVGLATEAKAEALLAYVGTGATDQNSESWPDHLRQAEGFLGARARLELERTLHHVKVVIEPGKPKEAKAYLGAQYHWR